MPTRTRSAPYKYLALFVSLLFRQIMSLEQLAVAKDRKDKLLSRVHKKRIELDFRDRSPHSENAIHCCRHCAELFSEKVGLASTPRRHARRHRFVLVRTPPDRSIL